MISKENKERIQKSVRDILLAVGENPDREGLRGTPERIARMCEEIFRGYDPSEKPRITTFRNGSDGITYDDMVVDRGDFYSLCEHHLRTFFGQYVFAYVPNPKGRILGISKVGRVVDYCAAKAQIQERLVHDIIDMLSDALGDENPPLGMALMLKGRHLCKEGRGSRKKGVMTSTFLTGIFRENGDARKEFIAICNNGDRP